MILLLRHGQTFWNREARIQGHMESDLTPLGVRQATAMAKVVAHLMQGAASNSWRLVSSPLGRASRTASIVSAATGLPVEIDSRLAEVRCGEWEGLLRADLAQVHSALFQTREWCFHTPGGETFEDVSGRARDWLASMPPEPERRIIAVSHGIWGRLARGAYAGLDRRTTVNQDIPQDAVFRLQNGKVDRFDCVPAVV